MNLDSELTEYLRNIPLTKGLTENELKLLYDYMKIERFAPNSTIFLENDNSQDFYIILEGEVEILKWDEDKKNEHQISKLGEGEIFGEMSFLDKQPRSSTVRTVVPTYLLRLSPDQLNDKDTTHKEIYNKIVKNIATTNLTRIRTVNQNYVKSLRAQIDELKIRNNFGILFITSIIFMGAFSIADNIVKETKFDTHNQAYSWGYLLTVTLPFVFLVKVFGYKLSDVGVTLKNWKQSLIDGVVISGISIAIILLIVKFYLIYTQSSKTLTEIVLNPARPFDFFAATYFIHSYLQEFVGRGVLQTSLVKFLGGSSPLKGIFTASILFGMVHVQRGYAGAAAAFIGSLIFGLIYMRTQNLLGVSIVHYVAGILTIHYLGVL